jgi:hypothetical protein
MTPQIGLGLLRDGWQSTRRVLGGASLRALSKGAAVEFSALPGVCPLRKAGVTRSESGRRSQDWRSMQGLAAGGQRGLEYVCKRRLPRGPVNRGPVDLQTVKLLRSRSVPQPNAKHKLMRTRWFPGLTTERSGLAEYAGVHVPDVGSELTRKLIAEPHPTVDIG